MIASKQFQEVIVIFGKSLGPLLNFSIICWDPTFHQNTSLNMIMYTDVDTESSWSTQNKILNTLKAQFSTSNLNSFQKGSYF